MNKTRFCQSCSMPLDGQELHGTEKNGSKSIDYCKFCYKDGSFTDPDMTLTKMQASIINKMDAEKIPADIIKSAVARLPFLKRWKIKLPKVKKDKQPLIYPMPPHEKYPLEEPPGPESGVVSEEELDRVNDEDAENLLPFESPEPGEGP